MAIRRATFPLPDVDDPLVAPFFEAAARGELHISGCDRCRRLVWYPEPCPNCGGDLTWRRVSGRATLFSWVVVRRAFLPAFAEMVPFVSALVALDEDPDVRLCTLVPSVDADDLGPDDLQPDHLRPDQAMTVVFRPLSFPTVAGLSVTVPMFVPA